jgi:hypothetical protein
MTFVLVHALDMLALHLPHLDFILRKMEPGKLALHYWNCTSSCCRVLGWTPNDLSDHATVIMNTDIIYYICTYRSELLHGLRSIGPWRKTCVACPGSMFSSRGSPAVNPGASLPQTHKILTAAVARDGCSMHSICHFWHIDFQGAARDT